MVSGRPATDRNITVSSKQADTPSTGHEQTTPPPPIELGGGEEGAYYGA